MTDFYRINKDLPFTTQLKYLNEMVIKLAGLVDEGKFDKAELDDLFSTTIDNRKFARQVGLGNTLGTYSGWSVYKAEGGYSIWKYAPTNYYYNALNELYFSDKLVTNKGQATAETTQLDKIFTYDDISGGGYTDVTTDISNEGADEVTVLENIGDYLYIGNASTFEGIALEFKTRGSNYDLNLEYYDSSSGTGWVALDTSDNLVDNTLDFKSNGSITFTAPTGWATTTINGQNLYWIRISTSTAPVTEAEVYYLTSGDSVEGLLSLSSNEAINETWKWCSYNGYVYVTIKNSGNPTYEGDEFITSSSSITNLQNFFIYNNSFYSNYEYSTYSAPSDGADNISFSNSGWSADNVHDAIIEASGGGGGSSNTYTTSFDNGDLVAGVLSVNHLLSGQYPLVTVYNNSGNEVTPDDITNIDANNITIDLSSFGVISGTWNLRVTV